MPSTLDKTQAKALHQALLDAFPHRAALSRMVRFGLNVNLEAIAGGSSLSDIAFALIEWAEAHDKVGALVAAAREDNATNPSLRAFAESYLGASAPSPAAPAPAPAEPAQRSLAKVRDVLASLYAPRQAAIVATDAGIDTRSVDLAGSALTVWDSILAEAAKHGRVDAILSVARAQYPSNPGLRTLDS